MRVAEHKRPLRLRRIRVEDRIDRIGVRGLQAGVLLEAIPDAVVRVDRVVDLDHDQILAVAVVQRLRALVGATRAIEQVRGGLRARQQRAVRIQRTGKNRRRRARRIAVKPEHLPVERDLLRVAPAAPFR